ncbi:hypothetical protein B0T18DRAFT_437186 [Schizothecium vesticola]|uniref:Circumsporozoite protein n=1 Tax=Schizothecium vesticola TaxID=314040 RepID=A0AA40F298_9PEZI|nr:hypothetical protein B0T18DRAFT_437186 [Schizothecium vesticola]
MYPKAILVAALLAVAEARFGQEGLVQNFIQALGEFGNPGEAATLGGQTTNVLLGGANACAKLVLADTIVATLGNDQAVIDAARILVAAEKNFNPFAQSIPTICDDASLPATPELRGIVPKVDPAVAGSDIANANAASSILNPFQADGLSVADVAIANGFANLTRQGSDGATSDAGAAAGNAGANAGAANNAGNNNAAVPVVCASPVTLTKVVKPAKATPAAGNNNNNAGAGVAAGGGAAGLDFGKCSPTIVFLPGLNGRKATEFTFQAADALVRTGQQEALNPNIITNRICDQLTNVCEANQAAKDACLAAKAQVEALGTRNLETANTFNAALGFGDFDATTQI